MSRITRFDKQNLKTLRTEINTALKAVLDKHGLTGEIENISFNESSFRTKLNVSIGQTSEDAERLNFERYCHLFGLKKEDFGELFSSNGTVFAVCGLNVKAKAYPLLGRSPSGSVYKFSHILVQGLSNDTVNRNLKMPA